MMFRKVIGECSNHHGMNYQYNFPISFPTWLIQAVATFHRSAYNALLKSILVSKGKSSLLPHFTQYKSAFPIRTTHVKSAANILVHSYLHVYRSVAGLLGTCLVDWTVDMADFVFPETVRRMSEWEVKTEVKELVEVLLKEGISTENSLCKGKECNDASQHGSLSQELSFAQVWSLNTAD